MKGRCQECFQEKELIYCKLCFNKAIIRGISESLEGDIAERVKHKIDERFENMESKIEIIYELITKLNLKAKDKK